MNENIDLTKILEGCPKEIDFYHTVYGTVLFNSIDLDSEYPIRFIVGKNQVNSVTKSGLAISDYKGECILFPSKDQRDWSKFERFWDEPKKENPTVKKFDVNALQPFDKVLVRDEPRDCWVPTFFWCFMPDEASPAICFNLCWQQCIPYNEKTKNLLGTKEDCPEYYKWWEK